MTVSITQGKNTDLLTLDPILQDVLSERKTNDRWGRRKRLQAIILGDIEEVPRKEYNTSHRRKVTGRLVTINQHQIWAAIYTANDRVIDKGYKAGRPPSYYKAILEFAHQCLDEGRGAINGLPCHWERCAGGGIIWENSLAYSMPKKNGHKYFHVYCAERLNLI